MPRIPKRLLFLGGVVLTITVVVLGAGIKPERGRAEPVPEPPKDVSLSFNFQGGPNLVFLCWSQSGKDVSFFDVGVESFGAGQPRQEVRYGVTTTPCGEALGTGEYMFRPDLYHFAVRACNNAGCSPWADASSGDRYWFAIPCADATGNACARPADLSAGR